MQLPMTVVAILARLEGASPRLTSSVHLVIVHLVLRTWLATSWSGVRIGMTQDTISPRRLGTRLAQTPEVFAYCVEVRWIKRAKLSAAPRGTLNCLSGTNT